MKRTFCKIPRDSCQALVICHFAFSEWNPLSPADEWAYIDAAASIFGIFILSKKIVMFELSCGDVHVYNSE